MRRSPVAVNVEPLLAWFGMNRRDLPWRRARSPYRVLVSEVMLQQTRVDTVVPYFARFLRRFPSLRALARAPIDDVLKAWEGLGYYRRARNLHRLASVVTEQFGGRLPDTREALAELPGMGPYTSSAVASLAFGVDVAVVDGNVRRVLARLHALKSAPAARWQSLADALLPAGRSGEFNEAMMELGATVCLPRKPRCGLCPLRPSCRAFRHGDPAAFPAARVPGKVPHYVVGAAVTLDRRGRVLIARRRDDAMLGGLWEFPGGKVEAGETLPQCIRRELIEELGLTVGVGRRLVVIRHAYSHFTIELHAYLCSPESGRPTPIHCSAVAWIDPAQAERYAFSRADLRILDALRASDSGPRRRTRAPAPVRG
jgi:A/G-specific adenine glycosylase